MTDLQQAPAGHSPLSPAELRFDTPDSIESAALVERAKGVLMSRYDLSPADAAGLLLVWSAQRRVAPAAVADVLLHDICEGREPMTEPQLARWLENCLRNLP